MPLIVKLPVGRSIRGKRRPNLVSLLDVLPALTEALDLPLTDDERRQFEGVDILADPPRAAFAFSQRSPSDKRHGAGENYSLTSLE